MNFDINKKYWSAGLASYVDENNHYQLYKESLKDALIRANTNPHPIVRIYVLDDRDRIKLMVSVKEAERLFKLSQI
jgi:hypothetical protein